jgi:hypothetical protein
MEVNEKAGMAFYNMLPESQHPLLLDGLAYQSVASQYAKVHFVATDVTVPKTYVVCTEDGAFPVAAQRSRAEKAGCKVIEIESDHSPFLRDVTAQKMVDIVREACGAMEVSPHI